MWKNAEIETFCIIGNIKIIRFAGRNISELQTKKIRVGKLFDSINDISREVSLRYQIIYWKIRYVQKQIEKLLKESERALKNNRTK